MYDLTVHADLPGGETGEWTYKLTIESPCFSEDHYSVTGVDQTDFVYVVMDNIDNK